MLPALRSWHTQHMACKLDREDRGATEVALGDLTHSEGKPLLWEQGALGTR